VPEKMSGRKGKVPYSVRNACGAVHATQVEAEKGRTSRVFEGTLSANLLLRMAHLSSYGKPTCARLVAFH